MGGYCCRCSSFRSSGGHVQISPPYAPVDACVVVESLCVGLGPWRAGHDRAEFPSAEPLLNNQCSFRLPKEYFDG